MNTKKTSALIWQDTQHQQLFKIIDLLNTDKSSSVIDKLTDYIDYHFRLEEEYMQELNYPKIESHIKAHHFFENRVNEYIKKDFINDDYYRQEFSKYLANWLTDHVYGIDKELEEFVLKSNKK